MDFTPGAYVSTAITCAGVNLGGAGSYATPVSYEMDFGTEHLSDSLGRGTAHSCVHRKYKQSSDYSGSQFGIPTDFGGGQFGVTTLNDGGRAQCASAAAGFGNFFWDTTSSASWLPPKWTDTTPSFNEDVIKNNLLQSARQLKADVLLNIVESNQIVPSVRSLTRSLPEMARNWKSIRKVVRTASGSYLAWKFGVSPILSDVMAIQRYLPKIRDGFKRHSEEKPARFSRKVDLNLALTPSTLANGYYPLNGHNAYAFDYQGRLNGPAEIRFVLVVKPVVKYLNELSKAVDFVSSRFATSPASLAWELVPFSFVVDWFVDVSGALRIIDKIAGFSPYEIVAFTRSRSYTLSVESFLDVFNPCGGGKLGTYGSAHQYKYYERSLASASATPVWNPRFGKNQAAISAALIAQALTSISTKRVINTAVNSFNKTVWNDIIKPVPAVARIVKRLQRT